MKYETDRDEILDAMTKQGWANLTGGTVEAPCGWFARVSILPTEVEEVWSAFRDTLSWESDQHEATVRDAITGHFVICEDSEGFVTVTEHGSEGLAAHHMHTLMLGVDRVGERAGRGHRVRVVRHVWKSRDRHRVSQILGDVPICDRCADIARQ